MSETERTNEDLVSDLIISVMGSSGQTMTVEEIYARKQGYQAARTAVLARMMPAEPSSIYDIKNGEWSVAWEDRTDEDQVGVYPDSGVVRFSASVTIGDRWCVCIPVGFDEDGGWDGWHLAWFASEADAVSARAQADSRSVAEPPFPSPVSGRTE